MTTRQFLAYFKSYSKTIDNLSVEPIFGEYIVNLNGKRIGILFQNQFYIIYTPTFEKIEFILSDYQIIDLFNWSYYKFIKINNFDNLEQIINHTYKQLYFRKDIVINLDFMFQSYNGNQDSILILYEIFLVFFHFAFEKGLLKIIQLIKIIG